MYAIVEFSATQELELVPCTWVNADKCLWPDAPADKAEWLVRRGAAPAPDFVECAASVKGIFRTYEEGRKELELSRYTCDLSTDEGTPKRRRIVRPKRCSDTDSGLEDYPVASQGLLEDRTGAFLQAGVLVSPAQQACGLNGSMVTAHRRKSGAHTADVTVESELQAIRSHQEPWRKDTAASSGKSCDGEHTCPRCLDHADFQRRVISNFASIRHTQSQILQLLSTTIRPQNEVAENTDAVVNVPFASVEELKAFDSGLTAELRNALIAQLKCFGTKTVPLTVRGMMAQLMTDQVARQFSMHGRKGKERFDMLKLRSLIFDAVKRTSLHKEATHDDVDTAIKDWLRRAKERCMKYFPESTE